MSTTFLWGLKRSGIHHIVNWLYANHGAVQKIELDHAGGHPQLRDGFRDPAADVAYFNNCGQLYSRRFDMGDLATPDFERAASRQATTLFGLEDCALELVSRTPRLPGTVQVLILRDPLNNVASRLKAGGAAPAQFRVDRTYIDLVASYCAEAIGASDHLGTKVVVNFNRFVIDHSYRDTIASALDVPNLDAVSEVSSYGGGSSFTGTNPLASRTSVLTRFRQRPVPPRLVRMLMEHDAVREACTTFFDYDLAQIASEG